MTSNNLCQCHCGTRIDVDEQLLEEREMWKEKYMCLQKQCKADIQILKENIYSECSAIMVYSHKYPQQQQFSQKEAQQNRITNQKNVEIKDLITRVVDLQSKLKVSTKEKQLLQKNMTELDAENSKKDEIINLLKNQSAKNGREWELRHEEELAHLRKKLSSNNKAQVEKIEIERQHLKHKVRQFEQKYQKIIPEVQKMKKNLTEKNQQNEELKSKIEKIKKSHEQKITDLKQQINDLQKIHATCPKYIKKLQNSKEELEREIQKCKKISKEVKVQPVYIDRPVEVEKVVEKIVEVEKVVKKFIDDPNSPKLALLEQDNNRLRDQLNNVLTEIKQMQEQYERVIRDYEANTKAYEENILKYKKQRQSLAQKISQQNKQIQMMQSIIGRMGQRSKQAGDGQKIVVHVKQDGTYQKTLEKLPNPRAQNIRKKR